MTGRNSFKKLTKDTSPKRRAYIEARKIEMREEMALHELRQAIGTSQKTLAEELNVLQPAVAKMERRSDIRISSLRKMVEAMGGSLVIKAHFAQGDVTITNYTDLPQ
ncbi:MAG: helix-turn-helix transcriptional regulator [Pseudomonadales bacterium]|nr:helix-turn-helix transcriptional regulator [Pseudomonadales bacterium]